ncbi:triphosphoribosyl-dephospho-CoA synthase [Carboxylicivirga taeanensis]|uniref:triphosphoribosyl-dephospho-CoA synthase n=1 Tax=Carboxylicivirga taeanensis TaxID=1416875 RepID=UPI003F6DC0B2
MELLQETIVFDQLLQAREDRLQQKLSLVGKGCHLVSLQLNIPGLPKNNSLLSAFIRRVEEVFERYLIGDNANNKWEEKTRLNDVAGEAVIYLFDKNTSVAKNLKRITENFEQSFELGRIVDLDVLGADGLPVSSGKAKACFICDLTAADCRKSGRHTISEVRNSMEMAIARYMEKVRDKEVVKKVAGYAIRGLLLEVALSPKPGLVCRNSTGAHADMDFVSFMGSAAAIAPYLTEISQLAISFQGRNVSDVLPQIKSIGQEMEQAMFSATNGVNTHKGAIFLMAISCFAVVRVVRKQGYLKLNAFSSVVQQLTSGLVQRELCAGLTERVLTHGQQCFKKYGLQAAGARGEVEQGLPTVLHHALPYLQDSLVKKLSAYTDEEITGLLVPLLLKIITVNNDTNVLYRHDGVVLEQLKQNAKKALDDWRSGNRQTYDGLVEWCLQKRISPGGSADLLALTLTLHLCQTEFTKEKHDREFGF